MLPIFKSIIQIFHIFLAFVQFQLLFNLFPGIYFFFFNHYKFKYTLNKRTIFFLIILSLDLFKHNFSILGLLNFFKHLQNFLSILNALQNLILFFILWLLFLIPFIPFTCPVFSELLQHLISVIK